MRKLYGLFVLAICNIATFFGMWQFYLYENIDSNLKIIILLIIFLIIMIIDLKSYMVLSKRIKPGLDDERRIPALKRVRQKKTITNILLTLLSICLILGNYVYYFVSETLQKITTSLEPTEMETYLIVNEDSSILDGNSEALIHIGFDETQESYQSLFERTLYEEHEKYSYVDYNPHYQTTDALVDDLFNHELDAIMINLASYELINNKYPGFKNQTRILETYTIKTSIAASNVNVASEAFNVLILGVDIRENEGDIHTNTRTDTIILASFNPKTMQASLISIPRDTYTPLSYNDEYDKLTHAGLYGVGCTIETIESLLDTEINYYAKFNFKALVGLVDALGGVDVDVKFSFSESDSNDVPNAIHVNQGYQTLSGEEALAYARHRNTQNDHVRNNSQQEVLQAILTKLMSFDTITHIGDLLGVLNTNMTTNLGRDEIIQLLTLVPNLDKLTMSTLVIEGEDYETYVPKYDEYLWITELTEDSLNQAKQQIQTILEGD